MAGRGPDRIAAPLPTGRFAGESVHFTGEHLRGRWLHPPGRAGGAMVKLAVSRGTARVGGEVWLYLPARGATPLSVSGDSSPSPKSLAGGTKPASNQSCAALS